MSRRPTFEQVQARRRARDARKAVLPMRPTNALTRAFAGLPIKESAVPPQTNPVSLQSTLANARELWPLQWVPIPPAQIPAPARNEEGQTPRFLPTYIG